MLKGNNSNGPPLIWTQKVSILSWELHTSPHTSAKPIQSCTVHASYPLPWVNCIHLWGHLGWGGLPLPNTRGIQICLCGPCGELKNKASENERKRQLSQTGSNRPSATSQNRHRNASVNFPIIHNSHKQFSSPVSPSWNNLPYAICKAGALSTIKMTADVSSAWRAVIPFDICHNTDSSCLFHTPSLHSLPFFCLQHGYFMYQFRVDLGPMSNSQHVWPSLLR